MTNLPVEDQPTRKAKRPKQDSHCNPWDLQYVGCFADQEPNPYTHEYDSGTTYADHWDCGSCGDRLTVAVSAADATKHVIVPGWSA